MKKIIHFALLLLATTATAQIPSIQKIVNGHRCDTCLVKYHFETANTLEYALVGGNFNSNRLRTHLSELEKSLPKENNQQRCYVTNDSIISIMFVDNVNVKKNPDAMLFLFEEGFDYKDIKVSASLNEKQIIDTICLTDLKPLKNFVVNKIKYNRETEEEYLIGERDNNSIEKIGLKTGDVLKIAMYNTKLKAVELTLYIKRVFDKPSGFIYYEAPLKSAVLKEGLQSFLNDSVLGRNVYNGDSTNTLSLNEDNIGVFLFNFLSDGDEIEYRFSDKQAWTTIRQSRSMNPFSNRFVIIDKKDIPPGTTRQLLLRYKNQPETEVSFNIQGMKTSPHISIFKIALGLMLASSAFGGWHYIKSKRAKVQLEKLHKKNKDIETRLSLLSGQLNPHFLFNSLHAIQGTINSSNSEEANEYITKVARFMRNIMDHGKKEFISLEEELALSNAFLQLEQKRKTFNFTINIEKQLDATQIEFPPLLLQPVLENSIRHAFVNGVAAPLLEILITAAQSNLVITIKDNGIGWNTAIHPEGHGLGLVRKRIALLNEKIADMPVSLNVTAAPNRGTSTIFTFKNWLA